ISWSFINGDNGIECIVLGKISYCFEENAKYWSFFIPEGASVSCVEYMLNMPDTAQCVITEEVAISQIAGFTDSPERYLLESLKFTGRIYLYIDEELTQDLIERTVNLGKRHGFSVAVRDRAYVKACYELSKPLVFISHDSRDKDVLVRNLALEMSMLLCPVWYDEFSLNVGDSLRENIERGLKEAKKCVVILSQNFISNGGWTKAEFDSIYIREIHEKKNVILPVWHNVSVQEVYEYSPRLADKVALNSSIGEKALAKKLVEAVTKPV
ncbi:MAG: toll/interleukin-1 receptor domain-containing protein, partial [Betaproteobacteria bacterium]